MVTPTPWAPPTLHRGELLTRLLAAPERAAAVRHVERLPARGGEPAGWPAWLAPELGRAAIAQGVPELWTHQRAAADMLHAGTSTVIATGTGSGKSLAYALPALHAVLEGTTEPSGRATTALYLAPTKALAADQARMLDELAPKSVRIALVDGDVPREERDWARKHAAYVLSNPDLLHHSLLPRHAQWSAFLRALRFVIVDEAHAYRGVFGAHVAQVLRRLRRICAHYGADPVFALASATVARPEAHAARLVGVPVTAVTADGAPRGDAAFVLSEPTATGGPVGDAAVLLADLVGDGARVVAFARSRTGVEAMAVAANAQLAARGSARRVAAYRAGYLPEERRALEAGLQSGELGGLAATNALELGVDVSALDAVVLAGYPGSRASMWQQAGRAGRAGRSALVVLIARADPFDQYLLRHPETLFGKPVEETVLDPGNPYVLAPHLAAAAAEVPLQVADLETFGPAARSITDELTAAGVLRRRPSGWYWGSTDRPPGADLRGTGTPPVRIAEVGTGRLLGTVDGDAAPRTVHAGAVYVHQGERFLVVDLDLDEGCAHVAPATHADLTYTTAARSVSDLRVLSIDASAELPGAGLFTGAVEVTDQVVAYAKLAVPSGTFLGSVPLDLPARSVRTRATWWTVRPDALAGQQRAEHVADGELAGALHAAEHTARALLPLVATCDVWDVGGTYAVRHPDTGGPTVFVHDRHPGGAGFAERAYDGARAWLTATRTAIAACGCADGCPACVQSPMCGRGNTPLAKYAAVRLLSATLGEG